MLTKLNLKRREAMRKFLGLTFLFIFIVTLTTNTFSFAAGETKTVKGEVFKAPAWQLGDSWTYQQFQRISKDKVSFFYTLTVVENSYFKGMRAYKVELKTYSPDGKLYPDFSNSYLYFSTDLVYLGLERPDKKIEEPLISPVRIRWPLNSSDVKQWRFNNYEPLFETNVVSHYYSSFEGIGVPAGLFAAFKIIRLYPMEKENFRGTYWYSPEVKNFVKKIDFYDIVEELLEYSIKK
jgi:hypothetical protein